MTTSLLFDFTVDKATKTVFVNREFAAELSLVWDAFTKQEILDQWWAPKPWMSKTKFMNFKDGGRRFYAMVSPEGQEVWNIQEFASINPTTHFKMRSTFADKDENIDTTFPSSDWDLNFSEQDGTTKVNITIKHKALADLEKMIEMGFQGGFTMTLNYLETLLPTLPAQTNTLTNNSPFDFTVDKTTKTVTIKREFAADPSLVWDAFTKKEILDQWWAPQPFLSKTKFMDFKVGGRRFYAMVSPDGSEHWSVQKYTSISPKTNFKMFNAFADKDENLQLPGSEWDLNFSGSNGPDNYRGTTVNITVYNESIERMERLLEGFTQGMKATMNTLENLLATLSKK